MFIYMKDKLLDNLMQMAGGAINVVQAIQENVQAEVKKAVRAMVDDKKFVSQEEFDNLKAEVNALREKMKSFDKRES